MDKLSAERRSANMRQIRSKNTTPELLLRRMLYRLGYRFRLHRKDLPGKPDLVFPSRRKAIFVHGCFWHQHPGCRYATRPATNVAFWAAKLRGNVDRDARKRESLEHMGWVVEVIWECASDPEIDDLTRRIVQRKAATSKRRSDY